MNIMLSFVWMIKFLVRKWNKHYNKSKSKDLLFLLNSIVAVRNEVTDAYFGKDKLFGMKLQINGRYLILCKKRACSD